MRWRRVVREHGPLAAVVIAAGALAVLELRPGHDWGDDFALYIDQARALVEGDVQEVIDRTTYTVRNSSWHSFSPYGYPWVVPLLLAPAYALFGIDYDAFKVVELVFFLGFLVVLHALLRPRLGRVATLAIVAFVGLNQAYTGWVNSVLSEFPFAFFVAASLLAIERVFAASRFGNDPLRQPPWWALAGVGVLLGVCANVRTEGVIVVLALAARQALTAYDLRDDLRRLAIPFAVPYVAGGLFHLLLNVLLPSDPGTAIDDSGGMGFHNWDVNISYYGDVLSGMFGLDGWWLALVLMLIIVHALSGVLVRWREDLPLALTTLGLAFVYLSVPFREVRYLYVVMPLALYFAVHGVRRLDLRVVPRSVPSGVLPVLGVLALVAFNTRPLASAVVYWRTYPDAVNGPHTPDTEEMWDEVRAVTEADDLVAFFRARTMNLYTGRQGLQLTSLPQILERADWYVMARGSTYSQCLIDDDIAAATDGRLEKVWENGVNGAGWTIWRVDRSEPLDPAQLAALPPCRPA
jgi:hypothetical protein